MGWQDQLEQQVNTTQWWQDLNEKQRAKIQKTLAWARKSIQTKEGAAWVARMFRRSGIFLSLDDDASSDNGKWAQARKQLMAQGYTLNRCVNEVSTLVNARGQGSQFIAVINNLRQYADQLEATGIDVTKINPKVLNLLSGMGGGHEQGCQGGAGGRCECGFRDVERRATELVPLRMAIVSAHGLASVEWIGPDGKDRTVDQVYHDINNVGSKLDAAAKLPQGTPIVTFEDGSRWVKLDCQGSKEEGVLMGHCGNQSGKAGDFLLSYRVPSKKMAGFLEPRLTFIITPTGKLGEMKGANNKKPSEAFHPAIIGLLKNEMVTAVVGGGYLPQNNFAINDLNDDNLMDLYAARPDLIKDRNLVARIEGIKNGSTDGDNPKEVPPPVKHDDAEDLEGEDNELPE